MGISPAYRHGHYTAMAIASEGLLCFVNPNHSSSSHGHKVQILVNDHVAASIDIEAAGVIP